MTCTATSGHGNFQAYVSSEGLVCADSSIATCNLLESIWKPMNCVTADYKGQGSNFCKDIKD